MFHLTWSAGYIYLYTVLYVHASCVGNPPPQKKKTKSVGSFAFYPKWQCLPASTSYNPHVIQW